MIQHGIKHYSITYQTLNWHGFLQPFLLCPYSLFTLVWISEWVVVLDVFSPWFDFLFTQKQIQAAQNESLQATRESSPHSLVSSVYTGKADTQRSSYLPNVNALKVGKAHLAVGANEPLHSLFGTGLRPHPQRVSERLLFHPNKSRQGGKQTRVQFNQTKQQRFKNTLRCCCV